MRYRTKEYILIRSSYRLQEPRVLYNSIEAYRIVDKVVPNPLVI
jgi:hypothetical protein